VERFSSPPAETATNAGGLLGGKNAQGGAAISVSWLFSAVMEKTACSGCGAMMEPGDVLYTAEARPVCARCYASADIVETDKRAGNNIKSAGFAALGAAGLSFMFNPLFLVTVSSVLSAIYALKSLTNKHDERFTKHIKNDRVLIIACSILALIINAIVVLIVLTAVHEVTTYDRVRFRN
jgi:hypothetical protein